MEPQESKKTVKVYSSIEEMKADEELGRESTPEKSKFFQSYYATLLEMQRKGLKSSPRGSHE